MAGGAPASGVNIAVVHREADRARDARKTCSIQRITKCGKARVERQWDNTAVSLVWIPSHGAHIGKSTANFPAPKLYYPKDNHSLVKLEGRGDDWLMRYTITGKIGKSTSRAMIDGCYGL